MQLQPLRSSQRKVLISAYVQFGFQLQLVHQANAII